MKTRHEDRYVVELGYHSEGRTHLKVFDASWGRVTRNDATLFRSASEAQQWANRSAEFGDVPMVCHRTIGVQY